MLSLREAINIVEAANNQAQVDAYHTLARATGYGDASVKATPEQVFQYAPSLVKFAGNFVIQQIDQNALGPVAVENIQTILSAMQVLSPQFYNQFLATLNNKYRNDPEAIDFLRNRIAAPLAV